MMGFSYFRFMQIKWDFKSFSELNIDELFNIMVLRQEVFIVEQDCPYMDADVKDQKSHHLLGYSLDGSLVAYLRLVQPGISYEEISLFYDLEYMFDDCLSINFTYKNNDASADRDIIPEDSYFLTLKFKNLGEYAIN